jgi:GDP-4-dehydro-6-deoxy-D-mannose reductase
MKAFITGINGFAGSHLTEFLLGKGYEVSGLIFEKNKTEKVSGFIKKIRLYEGDVKDYGLLKDVLEESHPEEIYHLAGLSHVQHSWKNEWETYKVNFLGTYNLLEAIKELRLNAKVLIVGSSDEYGKVKPDQLPIREDYPLMPLSPYGVSKACQELLALRYARSEGIHVVVVRAFNHTGPRQEPYFVCSDFAKQIVEADMELRQPVINVGDLMSERDFTDVRDVVEAYYLLLKKGKSGDVFNVCSGKALSIRWVLDRLLGFSNKVLTIKEDPKRLRSVDITVRVGDNNKIKEATGWQPEIPMEKTLEDLYKYWQEKVSGKTP